jgi:hypothetical protein
LELEVGTISEVLDGEIVTRAFSLTRRDYIKVPDEGIHA